MPMLWGFVRRGPCVLDGFCTVYGLHRVCGGIRIAAVFLKFWSLEFDVGSAVVPPFGSVDAFDLKPNGVRLWKLSDLECHLLWQI